MEGGVLPSITKCSPSSISVDSAPESGGSPYFAVPCNAASRMATRVGVPFAKSLDPVTKTNWEGTGVEPDLQVPSDNALPTAEKLPIEKIQAKQATK
jgi:hypothetical protein